MLREALALFFGLGGELGKCGGGKVEDGTVHTYHQHTIASAHRRMEERKPKITLAGWNGPPACLPLR